MCGKKKDRVLLMSKKITFILIKKKKKLTYYQIDSKYMKIQNVLN